MNQIVHDPDGRRLSRTAGSGDAAFPADTYRVSDAEREAALAELRRQTVAGRLSIAEFSERTDEALAARTQADLAAALRGLPRPEARSQEPARRRLAFHPGPIVALVIVLAVIGLSSGHGWVLVPLVWLAMGLLRPRRWSQRRHAPDAGWGAARGAFGRSQAR